MIEIFVLLYITQTTDVDINWHSLYILCSV